MNEAKKVMVCCDATIINPKSELTFRENIPFDVERKPAKNYFLIHDGSAVKSTTIMVTPYEDGPNLRWFVHGQTRLLGVPAFWPLVSKQAWIDIISYFITQPTEVIFTTIDNNDNEVEEKITLKEGEKFHYADWKSKNQQQEG